MIIDSISKNRKRDLSMIKVIGQLDENEILCTATTIAKEKYMDIPVIIFCKSDA